MTEQMIDVHLEVSPKDLRLAARTTDEAEKIVHEVSLRKAEEAAAERKGRLRHPLPVETYARQGMTPFGDSVLLVASRWVVDVPGLA